MRRNSRRQAMAFFLAFLGALLLASTAQAAGITADPGGSVTPGVFVRNGVPVVNIVAPDANGLSHNRYLDFNIPAQGMVFNNSAVSGTSVLAGSIEANSGFNGHTASVILNEVTGFSTSQLLGYAEVFGKSADLIIANPNGIYTHGGGFINTPRVTLTTGAPFLAEGKLAGFSIGSGAIMFDGAALDARTVASIDLVARNILLNSALVTNGDARFYAGQGIWRYSDGHFFGGNTSSEALAIDASNLGAMSAGRIFIVANEQGAGVRLSGDMSATADDIEISANGNISLNNAHAARDVDIKSAADVVIGGSLLSGKDSTVDAHNLLITGSVASAQRLGVHTSGDFLLVGQLAAGSALNLDGLGGVFNEGLLYSAGDINIQASLMGNEGGLVVGEGQVSISSLDDSIYNNAGVIYSGTNLFMTSVVDIKNTGMGSIGSGGNQNIFAIGDIYNEGGEISSSGNMNIRAGGGFFQYGVMDAGLGLSIKARSLEYRGQTRAGMTADIDIFDAINLQEGSLGSGGLMLIKTQSGFSSDIAVTNGAGIRIEADTYFMNSGTIDTLGILDVESGGAFSNSGRLYGSSIGVRFHSGFDNSGVVAGEQSIALYAETGDTGFRNASGGLIVSNGDLRISFPGYVDNRGGNLISQSDMLLDSLALNNAMGRIESDASIYLSIMDGYEYDSPHALENTNGRIVAGRDLGVYIWPLGGGSLGNATGLVQAGRDIWLTAYALDTERGSVTAGRDLNFDLNRLYTLFGSISVGGNAVISLADNFSPGFSEEYDFHGDLTLNVLKYIPLLEDVFLDAVGNITINADEVYGLSARSSEGSIVINTGSFGGESGEFYSLQGLNSYWGDLSHISDAEWRYFREYGVFYSYTPVSDGYGNYISNIHVADDIAINADAMTTGVQYPDASGDFRFSRFEAGHDVRLNVSGKIILNDFEGVIANHDVIIRSDKSISVGGDDWPCYACKILAGNDILTYGLSGDFLPEVRLGGIVQAGRDIRIRGSFGNEYDFYSNGQYSFMGAGRDIWITAENGATGSFYNVLTMSAAGDVNIAAFTVNNSFYQDVRVHADGRIYAAGDVNILADDFYNTGIISAGIPYSAHVPVSIIMVDAPVLDSGFINAPTGLDNYQGAVHITTPEGPASPGNTGSALLGSTGQGPDGIILPTPPQQPGTSDSGTGGTGNGAGSAGGEHSFASQSMEAVAEQQRLLASLLSDAVDSRKSSLPASPVVAVSKVFSSLTTSQEDQLRSSGLMTSADEADFIIAASASLQTNQGGTVVITARNSLLNIGQISAETVALTGEKGLALNGSLSADSLLLDAGNADLTAVLGAGWSVRRDLVAQTQGSIFLSGASVSVSGDIVLDAGRDIRLSDTSLQAGQELALEAAGNIDLLMMMPSVLAGLPATPVERSKNRSASSRAVASAEAAVSPAESAWVFGKTPEGQFSTSQSSLTAGCGLGVSAGGSVTAKAANLSSGCDTGIAAGGAVDIGAQAFSRSKTLYTDRSWQTIADTSQLQSSINSGGALSIQSGSDLLLSAAKISTGNDAQLLAGGAVLLTALQNTHSDTGSAGKRAITTWDNSSISNITTDLDIGGDLLINVGRTEEGLFMADKFGSVSSFGSSITTGGESYIYGESINLLAVKDVAKSVEIKTKKKTFAGINYGSSSSSARSLLESLQDSDLIAGDDVALLARTDINLIAANVSGNNINMLSGMSGNGSLNILGDKAVSETLTILEKSRFDIASALGGALAAMSMTSDEIVWGDSSKTSTYARDEAWVGSKVSATGDLRMQAADDISLMGSSALADGNIVITAGKNINLLNGNSSHIESHESESAKLGAQLTLKKNEASIFVGASGERSGSDSSQSYSVASLIQGGNVGLQAGADVNQLGSDIAAVENLSVLVGGSVNSLAAFQSGSFQRFEESFRLGVKAGVYQNISSSAGNLIEAGHGLGEGDNGVSKLSETLRFLDGMSQMANSGVSANISVLMEYSRQQQEGGNQSARISTLYAGHDLLQQAKNTVQWQGTQARAGNDLILDAGKKIALLSAQNQQHYKQGSFNGSVQYDILGSSTGALNVALGGSQQKETGTTHINSHANAGGELRLQSGGDAVVAGAVVTGQTLTARVAGDLTVASLQDKNHITGSSANIVIGRQAGGGTSLSLGGGDTDGDSAWVDEQTALLGRDSATVVVRGNTALAGAVIGGMAKDSLSLTTGGLTISDIHDSEDYRNTQANIGGIPGGTWSSQRPDGADANTSGSPRVDGGYESSHREQINRGTLTTGSIVVTGQSDEKTHSQLSLVNRDLDKAQEITRDESTSLDIYASQSSVGALIDPVAYGKELKKNTADSIGKIFKQANAALEYADDLRIKVKQAYINLPEEQKSLFLDAKGQSILAVSGDQVVDMLIAKGVDPQAFVDMLKTSEGTNAVKALNKVTSLVDEMSFAGESGFSVLKAVSTLKNGEHYTGADGEVNIVHATSTGMEFAQAFADLSHSLKEMTPEQAGVVLLGVNALMGGVVKTAVTTAAMMTIDNLVLNDMKEWAAEGMTASAHGAFIDDINKIINNDPAYIARMKVSLGEERSNEIVEDVKKTHEGTQFIIGILTEVAMGAGNSGRKAGGDRESGGALGSGDSHTGDTIPVGNRKLDGSENHASIIKAGKGSDNVRESLNRADDFTVQQSKGRYSNRKDISYRTADEVNSEFDGFSPPYQPGTRVTEYTTIESDQFVRVHREGNAARSWMMRREAIEGLSPKEIAKKYSLPEVPTKISDVNVPAGSRVRTGNVASNFDGNEGAIQYQWLGRVPEGAITNTRYFQSK